MRTLAPFIFSSFLPGIGHFFLGKYFRGILIFLLTIALTFIFEYVIFLAVIAAWTDIYYLMVKESGQKTAVRSLLFSLLVVIFIIPVLFFLLYASIFESADFVTDRYFNERNTKKEMQDISAALERHRQSTGRYPDDFFVFVNSKPIWQGWSKDSWRNNYQYTREDSVSFRLVSAGQDQVFDTEDDLVSEGG